MDTETERVAQGIVDLADELGVRAWAVHSRSSIYVTLALGGRGVVVRVSDHAAVSHRHPPTDWNIAPGRDDAASVRAALVERWRAS